MENSATDPPWRREMGGWILPVQDQYPSSQPPLTSCGPGQWKPENKKINKSSRSSSAKAARLCFQAGEWTGLGARAGSEPGAPRRGAARAMEHKRILWSPKKAAYRPPPFLRPELQPPKVPDPRATRTGGDLAKPAQSTASLRGGRTGICKASPVPEASLLSFSKTRPEPPSPAPGSAREERGCGTLPRW